jgi:acyl-CoA synthetase (NDP forming)
MALFQQGLREGVMHELHRLFRPESIALVGVPRGFKAGKVFLLGLLDQGFSGPVYPVHPHASEIDGLACYPSLSQVRGKVDMVIIMSPRETVADILEECTEKRVKIVVLYTSGYGETGDEQGREEERRMTQTAQRGGFRILGPNCMGVYSPDAGLAVFPGMPRTSGPVGFLSQSGSLSNLLTNACAPYKIFFRHVVSYGNGCDLDLPELLRWMGEDPEVRIICTYSEGVRRADALAEALKQVAGRKPVIMWKTGLTRTGSRAAASHTGSLAGRKDLWQALFRQVGVVAVNDMEHLIDSLAVFSFLPWEGEGRVVLLSGPGGPLVSAADAVEQYGLSLASFQQDTRDRLAEILPAVGTSRENPVDVGLGASFDLRLYLDALTVIAEDGNVDAVVVLGGGVTPEMNQEYVQGLARIRKASGKAILAVAFPGFLSPEDLLEPLLEVGIPVYPTPERALRAYAGLKGFVDLRRGRSRPAS